MALKQSNLYFNTEHLHTKPPIFSLSICKLLQSKTIDTDTITFDSSVYFGDTQNDVQHTFSLLLIFWNHIL